ncbi:hypothetical protein [Pseudomonas fulva]|uniref:hypothetical protein n=1 Tax=Pseudomonas fulva TaxID=47880 RepID=UPI00384B5C65
MILPTRVEIVELAQNGMLLEAVFSDRWGCRYQHFEPIAQELTNAHNEGDIDLLKTLSPGAPDQAINDILERYGDHRGYQGRRVYSLAIERLETSATRLLEALRILADLAADEAYEVSETLSRWCTALPHRPKELLDLIDSGQLNAGELYSLSIAIRTGLKADLPYFSERAYHFIRAGSSTEKQLAIQALSDPPLCKDADWRRALDALANAAAVESSEVLRGALTNTLLSWARTIPSAFSEELETLIGQISNPTTPRVAHHLAYGLAFSFDGISPPLRNLLLSLLSAIDLAPQTQKLLDMGLAHLVKAGGAPQVRTLITGMLLQPNSQVRFQAFDCTIRQLVEGPAEDFETWTVEWLRTAPDALCIELKDGLFQHKDEYSFQTNFNRFDFTESEVRRIARRAISTFFVKPEIATSLLVGLGRCSVSLIQSFPDQANDSTAQGDSSASGGSATTANSLSLAKAIRFALRQTPKRSTLQLLQPPPEQDEPPILSEVSQDLSELLFNPLLLNYTRIREKLEPIADASDDHAAPIVQHALDRLKQYCDAFEEVGFIAELQPSERERQLEGQRRSDVMNDMMRESRKSSPLASLFSESILLHGNGMVAWIDDRAYQSEGKDDQDEGNHDQNEGKENQSKDKQDQKAKNDGERTVRPSRRMEQPLASFSHSFELPREEVLDPTGLHSKLLSLRSQGRPE